MSHSAACPQPHAPRTMPRHFGLRHRCGLRQAALRSLGAPPLFRNLPPYRQVLECASPLALSDLVRGRKSGRGLPQSKTLARLRAPRRGSWSQCMPQGEMRLFRNRPTPDPSREGNRHSSVSCPLPLLGGVRGGFMVPTQVCQSPHRKPGCIYETLNPPL